ncbi:MAG: hypothetical protein MZW92_40395 [Comamonadaceae bacterium]|nr:hypothetical protein [Comamonadaceae bacterium]
MSTAPAAPALSAADADLPRHGLSTSCAAGPRARVTSRPASRERGRQPRGRLVVRRRAALPRPERHEALHGFDHPRLFDREAAKCSDSVPSAPDRPGAGCVACCSGRRGRCDNATGHAPDSATSARPPPRTAQRCRKPSASPIRPRHLLSSRTSRAFAALRGDARAASQGPPGPPREPVRRHSRSANRHPE